MLVSVPLDQLSGSRALNAFHGPLFSGTVIQPGGRKHSAKRVVCIRQRGLLYSCWKQSVLWLAVLDQFVIESLRGLVLDHSMSYVPVHI